MKDSKRSASWTWRLIGVLSWLHSSLLLLIGGFGNVARRGGDGHSGSGESVRGVLVVRLDGIGDLVLGSGLFKSLREFYRHRCIILVVRNETINLVEKCPHIDYVYSLNTRCAKFAKPFILPWRIMKMVRLLRTHHQFDVAMNPRWDTDGNYAGFLIYLSRPLTSVAFTEKVAPRKRFINFGFDRLYTTLIDSHELRHEIEWQNELLRSLGASGDGSRPELWISPEDDREAKRICEWVDAKHLIAMAPGAGHPRRMWPIENFVQLAVLMRERYDVGIVILGDDKTRPLGDLVVAKLGDRAANHSGATTLRVAAAVLMRCCIFIGNDSGLIHIAAAANIPVVEVSCHPVTGSEMDAQSPFRFAPVAVKRSVLQPMDAVNPCRVTCEAEDAHCIKNVAVESVFEAAERLLAPKHEHLSDGTQ